MGARMVALRVLCVPKERISLRLIMKHVCSVLTAAVVGAQLLALAMLVLAEATTASNAQAVLQASFRLRGRTLVIFVLPEPT